MRNHENNIEPKAVKTKNKITMAKPCCSMAHITYPYLNEIVCISCGTFRVPVPKHTEKVKKIRKRKVKEDKNDY